MIIVYHPCNISRVIHLGLGLCLQCMQSGGHTDVDKTDHWKVRTIKLKEFSVINLIGCSVREDTQRDCVLPTALVARETRRTLN